MFSCKFCETIKNIFITEHLRPAVSRKWKQKNVLFFYFSDNAIRPKLCRNCAFPQNFHTKKLGEIKGFWQGLETSLANIKLVIRPENATSRLQLLKTFWNFK